MSDEALRHQVLKTDIFAEVEPNHKERIILALKKAGKVVGYIGDGINDASALHAADVGISVNTAVDVAKEAADIVLLDHDLNVLIEGVKEGRRPLPIHRSIFLWPQALILETCLAWLARLYFCLSYPYCLSKFC